MPVVEIAALSAASLLILFGPGLIVGLAGALRGWILVGAAPVATLGIIAVFAPVLPVLGVPWSPVSFLAVTIGSAAVATGLRVVLGRLFGASTADDRRGAHPWSPAQHLGVAAAVLSSAGIGLLITGRASRRLTAVPQWHDSSFHANAVRLISDTGDSSPSALGVLLDPAVQNPFYPNGYHVLVATIRQLGDFGVVATLDMVNGIVIGLFALSLVTLVKACTGSPALCAATGILACSVSTFPYDVLVWGPLFPFTFGIALVPAFVALFCHALDEPSAGRVVLVALSGLGLVVIHTSAAVTAGVLAVLFLGQRWITTPRSVLRDVGSLGGVAVLAVVFGAALITTVLSSSALGSTAGINWAEEGTAASSLGQLITSSRSDVRPQWWFAVLLLVGLCSVHRERFRPVHWWLAGCGFFSGVYVLTASSTSSWQRALASAWSDDPFRLAAVAVPGLIVLAAVGMVATRDAILRLADRVRGERVRPAGRGVALAAVVLVIGLLTGSFYVGRNTEQLARLYPDGPIVSTEKLAAMAWLSERVPPGTVVANDPFDGSPWLWAVEGVRPLFGSASMGRPDDGTDLALVLRSLNRLDTDPRVQTAIRDLRISYVFVSDGTVVPGRGTPQGLQNLDAVRALRAVYRAPSVQIYEVVPGAVSAPSMP